MSANQKLTPCRSGVCGVRHHVLGSQADLECRQAAKRNDRPSRHGESSTLTSREASIRSLTAQDYWDMERELRADADEAWDAVKDAWPDYPQYAPRKGMEERFPQLLKAYDRAHVKRVSYSILGLVQDLDDKGRSRYTAGDGMDMISVRRNWQRHLAKSSLTIDDLGEDERLAFKRSGNWMRDNMGLFSFVPKDRRPTDAEAEETLEEYLERHRSR